MADTLATLIKLSAQKVEKIQVQLAAAQRQLAEVTQAQTRWKEALARADHAALEGMTAGDAEGLQLAGLFTRRVDNELATLAKIEQAVNENIAAVTATLATLFAEQKRYEILHEQQQLAAHKKHAKKVQAELDDTSQKRRPF